MIHRDILVALGWSEDLIAAVIRQGDQLNREISPLEFPLAGSEEPSSIAGSTLDALIAEPKAASVLLWRDVGGTA